MYLAGRTNGHLFTMEFCAYIGRPFATVEGQDPSHAGCAFYFLVRRFSGFKMVSVFNIKLQDPACGEFIEVSCVVFFLVFVGFISLLFPEYFLDISLLFLFHFLLCSLQVMFVMVASDCGNLSYFL